MPESKVEPPPYSLIRDKDGFVYFREEDDGSKDQWRVEGYDSDGESRDYYHTWAQVQKMTKGQWDLITWDDL